ncbi:type 1 glutamine amidotransferase domain-containing protein [Dyella sp. EPa41]|uniref:type 1 glutamine amidotransferase domain-containing protein n=1 Tax=Dyella sp. EPa41 TaxID=1561194 RepID=UPI0019155EF4|nr:type 1 glutamine amidotransferase domain-containing protein [Dyella sp. EPa41]
MKASSHVKPVLFVVTSHGSKGNTGQPTGYYLGEVTHPLAELEDAGIPVEFASIQGGEPPVDGLELDDPANARFWNDGSFRESMKHTLKLGQVDPSRYSAIYFAGGHGAMWDFPTSPDVARVTRAIYEQGSIVAAVCHGPAALANVKLSDGNYLVAGKRVSAFTNEEENAVGMSDVVPFLLADKLKEDGALHEAAPMWTSKVIMDGRLITGQNPQSASGVGAAIRDALLK